MNTMERQNNGREPTADELSGIEWWNSMTEAERTKALELAGWKPGGSWTPSAADAWAVHKHSFGLNEPRRASDIDSPATMVVIKRFKRTHHSGTISHYSIRHRFDRVYQIFHDDPYAGIPQPYEFDYKVISGYLGDLASAETELRRRYADVEEDI